MIFLWSSSFKIAFTTFSISAVDLFEAIVFSKSVKEWTKSLFNLGKNWTPWPILDCLMILISFLTSILSIFSWISKNCNSDSKFSCANRLIADSRDFKSSPAWINRLRIRSTRSLHSFFYKNKVYKNSETQNRDILRTSLEQFEAERFKTLIGWEDWPQI